MKTGIRYVGEHMSKRSDCEYLLRRHAQEHELALAATDFRTAAIHASMAAEYERRLAEMVSQALFPPEEATAPDWRSATT
jgi:hypothetical protein